MFTRDLNLFDLAKVIFQDTFTLDATSLLVESGRRISIAVIASKVSENLIIAPPLVLLGFKTIELNSR